MPGRDIIAVGASAGGVEALIQLVQTLPGDLPAAVFVVLHVSPHGSSMLPAILSHKGKLPAHHARDGEPIAPGRIYVAPPDFHLIVRAGRVGLSRGPTENGVRPSADPLLRTAARSYGDRVIGVILSGSLDDGTAGLTAVKQQGGLAVVQDPDDALFSGMPRSALKAVAVDHCVPLGRMAPLLVELVGTPAPQGVDPISDDIRRESAIADRLAPRGSLRSAQSFRKQAEESKKRAALIRQVLVKAEPAAEVDAENAEANANAGPNATEGRKGTAP